MAAITKSLVNLPDEMLVKIAQNLDRFSLLALSQICRRLFHLSLYASFYWHSDYVPAFLPVAPIKEITATQFREAAVRSLRTHRTLMGLIPNPNIHRQNLEHKRDGRGLDDSSPLHQTPGLRFVFKVKKGKIMFWDAWTGQQVASKETTGNLPLNASPFSNSELSRKGRQPLFRMATSVGVSTDKMRLAIVWSGGGPKGNESVLERVEVTFKTTQVINSTTQGDGHGSGGDSDLNPGKDDSGIYAKFEWKAPVLVYEGGPLLMSDCCRMTRRHVLICFTRDFRLYLFIRVYDWDDPFRQSYLYHERHERRPIDLFITASHVLIIEGPEYDEKKQVIYLRSVPLSRWFSDSNTGLITPSTSSSLDLDEEDEFELTWLNETHFPESGGRMNLSKEEYEEIELELSKTNSSRFYAVGNASTLQSDPPTFVVLAGSESISPAPTKRIQFWVITMEPATPVVDGVEQPQDVDTGDGKQGLLRIVDHGYHNSIQSPLIPSIADGSNTTNKSLKRGGKRGTRSRGSGKRQGALHAANRQNTPQILVHHLCEDKKIRKRENFLVSKDRTITREDFDSGFDAKTGIVLAEENWNTKAVMWYS